MEGRGGGEAQGVADPQKNNLGKKNVSTTFSAIFSQTHLVTLFLTRFRCMRPRSERVSGDPGRPRERRRRRRTTWSTQKCSEMFAMEKLIQTFAVGGGKKIFKKFISLDTH
jgi:hypothetical protein